MKKAKDKEKKKKQSALKRLRDGGKYTCENNAV